MNGHHFDTKLLTCILNLELNRQFTITASFVFMIVHGLCLMFFYLDIFVTSSLASSKVKKDHIQNRKISAGLFASMILFFIAAFPFALFLLLDSDLSLPQSIYM